MRNSQISTSEESCGHLRGVTKSFLGGGLKVQFQTGQSLIEVIVAATVGILVVTALTFATIFSLRNAGFAKNSSQATKLAQEGIERVRSIRDRDSSITTDIVYRDSSRNINIFSELFSVYLSHEICNVAIGVTGDPGDNPCYFRFNSGVLTKVTSVMFETVGSFERQVTIGDQASTGDSQKTVTVIVKWTDFAGPHESKLTTILRKL